MRETVVEKKKRILEIIKRLRKAHPAAKCALHFSTPMQLLAATILSAQCTDKRVNKVTPPLFERHKTPEDFARMDRAALERAVKSTGFYRNKAKNIIGAAQEIASRFGGKIPKEIDKLVTLPGVGRKTANVLLGNAFDIPGLTVDTHMIRLNRRLGLTRNADPVKIEFDLMPLVPQKDWTEYSHLIIHHGRGRCVARNPDCPSCEIRALCPSAGKK